MIRIDYSDLSKLTVSLKKLSDETEINVSKVIKDSAFNIQRNAMSNLANNGSVKTGHLRRSISVNMGFCAFFNHYSILNIRSMYSSF